MGGREGRWAGGGKGGGDWLGWGWGGYLSGTDSGFMAAQEGALLQRCYKVRTVITPSVAGAVKWGVA